MRKSLVLLVVVLTLVAAGCLCPTDHVTGGGFIAGVHDDDTTANFGFNVKCAGDDTKGQLTYHDGLLKIKGTVTGCEYKIVDRQWTLVVLGDWVPQGKSNPHEYEGGTFKIMGSDEGEPGIDDEFFIKLKVGGSTVYENGGVLLGGNIQVHDDE